MNVTEMTGSTPETPEPITESEITPESVSEYNTPELVSAEFTTPEAEYNTPEPEFNSTAEFTTSEAEYNTPEPEFNYTAEITTPEAEYNTPEPEFNSTAEFTTPEAEYNTPEPEFNSTAEFTTPGAEYNKPEPEFNSTAEFTTPESEYNTPEPEFNSTAEFTTPEAEYNTPEPEYNTPEPESEYVSATAEHNSTYEPISEYNTPEPEYNNSTAEPASEYFSPEPEYNSTAEPLSEYFSPEPEYNSTAEPASEYFSPEPEYNSTAEPLSEYFSPEPEYNSTAEPASEYFSPEPEYNSSYFAEPEFNSTSEPFPEFPEPEAVAEAWPEPGPNWDVSYKEWGEAWPLHVYIFGLIYVFLMVFGILLISAMFAGNKEQRRSKTTIALNSMISFFGATRALNLFLDPYSSTQAVPFLLSHILWSLGFPGLTASFSIVLLILLDTTKMDIAPPKFQKLSNIVVITGLHLLIVTVVDILVMYLGAQVEILLVMCQMLFVIYGLVLAIGFSYAAYCINRNLSASSSVKDEQTVRLLRLTKTIYISAIVSFAICVTNLYSAVSDFGVFSNKAFIESWPWWILQTTLRVEEVAASMVVLTIFIKTSPTKTLVGYFAQLCPRKSGKVSGKDVEATSKWTDNETTTSKMKHNSPTTLVHCDND